MAAMHRGPRVSAFMAALIALLAAATAAPLPAQASTAPAPPAHATTAQPDAAHATTTQPDAAHATTAQPIAAHVPRCERPGRAASMLLAGALTVSPEPGTLDATPQTQISMLGVSASRILHVRVLGSRSGVHRGRLESYSQGDGASYVPSRPFQEGERVTVSVALREGAGRRRVSWRFWIDYRAGLGPAYLKRRRHRAPPAAQAEGEPVQRFRSAPQLRPPVLTVTVRSRHPQPGYLFMSPFSAGQAGPMIVNDSGQLVWFDPVNVGALAATKATNLQVQRYEGQPVLTWWEDPLRAPGRSRREPQDVIYDSSYQQVAAVHAGNGLTASVHELQITPRGTALIPVTGDIRCNLESVGGTRTGSIWDSAIQEIDIRTGLVRWEWNSLDHVSMKEAYDSARVASAGYPFDYFHLNSIQAIAGDSLLISARNTWAMYDLSRRTGRIRWRLGGKHSSFRMLPGTRTAWQHDARELTPSPGRGKMLISVFDDGAVPKVHDQSRALLEVLSLRNRTARLKRVFTNSPPLLAGSQGSVEALPGGNTVVGWGQEPWVTEFGASGQITFDAHLPRVEQSYRALRYEWQGTPRTPPSIAVEAAGAGQLAVYASWNGATDVASWRVLAGPSEGALTPIATAPRSGFETRIDVPSGGGSLIQVQALNAAGEAIGASAPRQA